MSSLEFAPLVQAIDFSHISSVLDPWCGTGTTRTAIGPAIRPGGRVFLSDIDISVNEADAHGDALDTSYLRQLAEPHEGMFDAVVTSPRFDYADLALPPLLAIARFGVFMHISSAWLANPSEGRSNFLSGLAAEGRLHVIVGSERAQTHWKPVYVCIFSSIAAREKLLMESIPKATISFGLF
jgi:hypothetical protein